MTEYNYRVIINKYIFQYIVIKSYRENIKWLKIIRN